MRLVAISCLLLMLVACGDQQASSPVPDASTTARAAETEQVVDTMMRAIEDGDCDAVKRVVVTPSAIDCAQIGEASAMLAAEGVDLDRVTYAVGAVAGDSATVAIVWDADVPAESIDVQRVDGRWLVVFDSTP